MMTINQSIKDIKTQTTDKIVHKQKREQQLIALLDRIREQILGEDKEMRAELEILKDKVSEAIREERLQIKQLIQQLAELESMSL